MLFTSATFFRGYQKGIRGYKSIHYGLFATDFPYLIARYRLDSIL
jgi:hypothetical protein